MLLKKIAAITLCLFLAGCGLSSKTKSELDANPPESSTAMEPAMTNFYGEELSPEAQANLLNQRIVYFDFDSSNLGANDERILRAHAKYLVENPTVNLRVSGHTDERGSREYNVALGEKRARSVGRFLEIRGIPADRLVIVSYGKEQPAELGNNELAWAKNRRAELDYETN